MEAGCIRPNRARRTGWALIFYFRITLNAVYESL